MRIGNENEHEKNIVCIASLLGDLGAEFVHAVAIGFKGISEPTAIEILMIPGDPDGCVCLGYDSYKPVGAQEFKAFHYPCVVVCDYFIDNCMGN